MSHGQSLLFALAAYFVWVLYDATIKFGQQIPTSPLIILSIVSISSIFLLLGHAWIKRDMRRLHPKRWKVQALAGLCSTLLSTAVIIALKHLPLTLFYVLFFTTPLVVTLLSAVLGHEKLTRIKVACLIAGFVGTAIAIGIQEISEDFIGYLAVCCGILGFSGRTLVVRHLGQTVTVESTLFLCYVSNLILGTLGLAIMPPETLPTAHATGTFIFAGGMSTLGCILYFRALQHTQTSNVAQLHYTQVIFGAIFGYFLWNEIPTWNLLIGSTIIIASGIILAAQGRKKKITVTEAIEETMIT